MAGKDLLLRQFYKNLKIFLGPTSTDTCIVDAAYQRTCFRVIGSGTFDSGNAQCQALGGHLPLVKTSIVTTFLANNFGGNIWMSLKTTRYPLQNKALSLSLIYDHLFPNFKLEGRPKK